MSELWFTVGVPATVGVATALYTTGGRAALARRAIRQELEIAKMLPEGLGQASLERMAGDKAVLYASRWVGPQPLGARDHLILLGTATAGFIVAWLGGALVASISGDRWLTAILLLFVLVGMAAAAGGAVSWLSLMWMADNAKTRTQTIRIRRERLARHLESATPAVNPEAGS